ncbi:MAG: chemotaxis protein CheB [Luteimonas sp.]
MTDAIRTVVLARAGAACDRVVEGLIEAGAELVGTLDPSQHAPDALEALAPAVLVVVLDPSVEDALDAFEAAFAAPGRTVIFEEAALVLERTGWDAARWIRHLAAKLRGLGDVLPPSAAVEPPVGAASPASREAPPVSAAALSIDDAPLSLEPLSLEFDAHAQEDTAAEMTVEAPPPAEPDPTVVAPLELEYDANAPAAGPDGDAIGPLHAVETAGAPEDATHLAFDPVAAEIDTDAPAAAPAVEFSFDFELAEYDEMSYTPPVAPPREVRDLDENLAGFSDAPAPAVAPPTPDVPAPVEPPPLPPPAQRVPLSLQDEDTPSRTPAPVAPPVATPPIERMSLALVDEDAAPVAAASPPEADTPATRVPRDLSSLESRISGLSLADEDSYGHGPVKGVVLIAGGLGGPDAVRQLLGALPEGFPRPVLVRLQLDGGRYDRLVRQMERATAMPVQLAETGMTLSPGEIYFLPPELLPVAGAGGLRFAESDDITALADAVPADDSAVLLLSGADPALVDVAMGPAWQGALVGGQSEEGCYDPAAARAVAERGGPSGNPIDIADWLIARWMPGERNFDSGGLSL